MNTRKLIIIVIAAMLWTTAISAQMKFRLGGSVDWNKELDDSNMGGLRLELIDDNLGFGLEIMADSDSDRTSFEQEASHYAAWQGEMFLSYHIFGNQSFIDPYAQVGYGNGGQVVWNEEAAEEVSLALYPSLGWGVNAVFEEGLVMGFRNSYRWGSDPIPHGTFPLADVARNQFTLHIGYQFGGRQKKDRNEELRERDEDCRGSWKWVWVEDDDY